MNILGISAFYHDSAAALVQTGRIVAAAQEERFTRRKHDPHFPKNAVAYCLEQAGLAVNELHAVVFYDKPLLKFERLLETYYGFAPKGLASFIQSMPVWLREKMFLRRVIHQELKALGPYDRRKLPLLFPEHHLSHAASAFYPSPFEEAAILTLDGVGEWATASIGRGRGKDIEILKELRFPHSLGLLYSAFTYFLGFSVNSGEYKLMGLAPYGNPEAEETARYEQIIKTELIDLKEDGSLWLNPKYFTYATGLRMVNDRVWARLFGFPRRPSETHLQAHHANLGLAIQRVTEDIVIKMAAEAKRLTGAKYLCLAGGVALNCVANGKLLRTGIFDDLFIQPAAGDAGGALGAALAAHHLYFEQKRQPQANALDAMQGSYLGPEFSALEIEKMSRKHKAVYQKFDDFEALAQRTAGALAQGQVVGWFQGRMEFGPRALGNRSILGDPRSPEMQKKLNLKIKYREGFRPFAPSVLAEDTSEYLELDRPSPYMLLVADVHPQKRKPLPSGYYSLPMMDRLYVLRSQVPSITHVDMSARIQSVHRQTNPRYWGLINAFKQQTGYGLVVNTSFNVRGEPIVATPEDAYRCFMRTEMDCLVIGDFFYLKTDQPNWAEKANWKEEFKLD